jgi:hypothetical protein
MQLRAVLRLETPMASDDPIFDPIFEKALARHLRSTPPDAASAQRSACADAETLAAYHERLLAPDELNAWKTHIAGCERCQETLAQLEATEEIPLIVADAQLKDSHVVVMQPAASRAASQAPAPGTASVSSKTASQVPWAQPRRISSATRRWIAPAGALAAGLLAWVVWHEDHLQKPLLQPTVAENRRYESAPPVSQSAPSPTTESELSTPKSSPAAPGRVSAVLPKETTRDAGRLASGDRTDKFDEFDRDQTLSDLRKRDALKDSVNAKSHVGPSNSALQQQSNAMNYATADGNDLKQDAPVLNGAAGVSGGAVAGKPPAVPLPKALPPTSEFRAPAPAAPPVLARQKSAAKKELRDQTANQPEVTEQSQTVVVTADAGAVLSTSQAMLVEATPSRIIPVPGTKVIWKIEDDGRVRRTANLGDSWQPQNLGVNATMLSGSAPSEKVCWLVGTFGTVLVTTDAGAHWTKSSVPIASSVDRITAFDAQHAVVTLQSTNVQFETFDNGQTWRLVAKK